MQTAAKLVLEPIFEADMDPAAYGYRPGRSASEAIQAVLMLLRQHYTDVVDADLSQYFDTIPHHELMLSIARRIVDRDMLRLIKQWLKAPVETTDGGGRRRMEGGKASRQGTPQGGVISPLVANLYMNRFLKHWRQSGRGEALQAHVINYADDFVILSRGHATEALAWTDRVMKCVGLSLNRTKTCVRDARQDGSTSWVTLRPALLPADRPMVHRGKSVEEERAASEGQGGRDPGTGQHGDMGGSAGTLNRLLRGWCGYFSPGSHYATDRAIEAHLYDRVRNFLARRQKLPTRGSRSSVWTRYSARWVCCTAHVPHSWRHVVSLPRSQSESRMREIRTSGSMSLSALRQGPRSPRAVEHRRLCR